MVGKTERSKLFLAIEECNLKAVKAIVTATPEVLHASPRESSTWLSEAVDSGSTEIIEFLIKADCDVNSQAATSDQTTPLETAVSLKSFGITELLLESGANPNLGRPLVAAVSGESAPHEQIKLLEVLLRFGADLNQKHDMFGDKERSFSVVEWAESPEVIEYLVEQGALAGTAKRELTLTPTYRYFTEKYGPVATDGFVDLFGAEGSSSVFVIPPSDSWNCFTIFSDSIPLGWNEPIQHKGSSNLFDFFCQIPADAIGDQFASSNNWLIEWTQQLASAARDGEINIEGLATIIDNGDPPAPFSPTTKMCSLLLLANEELNLSGNTAIRLYRLLPIFLTERNFEMERGLAELLKLFDVESVSEIVNFQRHPCV